MTIDLKIERARLSGHEGLWSIAINKGDITELVPTPLATPAHTILNAD